jgi:hypothetical protein
LQEVEKGFFPNADPEKTKEEGAIREKQSFGELNAWSRRSSAVSQLKSSGITSARKLPSILSHVIPMSTIAHLREHKGIYRPAGLE